VLHRIATGDQGATVNLTTAQAGYLQIGNASASLMSPSVAGVTSDTNIHGLALLSATADTNSSTDMLFLVQENDNTDFATLTTSAFQFRRLSTTLFDITRAGAVTLGSGGNNNIFNGGIRLGTEVTGAATTNDLAITGVTRVRFSLGGTATINGFDPGTQGQVLYCYSTNANTLTINHESVTATSATGRILTSTYANVTGARRAIFVYDTAASRWIHFSA
jgi:hypothetical protein